MKVGMVSLGCSKNLVDSEILLGELQGCGFTVTPDAAKAEIIIVNTCGFIEPAKQESINTILEMARYKAEGRCRFLVVCGCLSQRYGEELRTELPEIDLFWGVKDQRGLAEQIAALAGTCKDAAHATARVLTTPPYRAYLRIADGCDNRCTYCAIPLIRGDRVSVPMEQLIEEAKALSDRGVKELTLIAQDTSAYGMDIYGKPALSALLKELAKIEKLHWIRVLYTYPNTVDVELLDTIQNEPKVANYIDMPIQHIDDDVLTRMNRHGSSAHIQAVMQSIRERDAGFILRTTVMVGFPGETEEQFGRLTEFLKRQGIDRVGAFAFSPEDGTAAAEMEGQIPEEVKQARLDAVMRMQREIALQRNQQRIGETYEVLVERVEEGRAYGRSYAEAPEVDGLIQFIRTGNTLHPGDFTMVKITNAKPYDLEGEEL
ncbi:MAG: 30S ribosomal protein S12 methylthiotransferase RimO [Clostridia bacterium]|nr:30S ribosomal protein S12 methylthiotransferase RimO [Clostridia bacterium]